ncbi:MAG: glycosyltransferase family 2 protein [Acidobacteriota bacterium]
MPPECDLLLSIIIPVYNVEQYLEKSLSSVAGQTLDKERIEVIVVDDASTDSSLAIAREFEARFLNFHVIALPENTPGGTGIPSNIAIRQARGKYIGFVDGDDWVEPGMFERMLEKAESEKADLVIRDFKEYDELLAETIVSYDRIFLDAVAAQAFSQKNRMDQQKAFLKLSPVPWRKIYLRSFLLKNDIFYPEGNHFFEDNPLHWFSLILAERVVVLPEPLVVHRKNREGQTMCSGGEEFLAFVDHGRTIKTFLQSKRCYADFKHDFLYWLINQCPWILPKMEAPLDGRFIKGVSSLLKDFNRSDLVDYFRLYPRKPVVMNRILSIVRGRSFLYLRLHLKFFRYISTLYTIFYIYGIRGGLKKIRKVPFSRLFSGEQD